MGPAVNRAVSAAEVVIPMVDACDKAGRGTQPVVANALIGVYNDYHCLFSCATSETISQ